MPGNQRVPETLSDVAAAGSTAAAAAASFAAALGAPNHVGEGGAGGSMRSG